MDSVKSMADREVTNGNVTLDAGGGVVHPHDEFNVFFEFVVPGSNIFNETNYNCNILFTQRLAFDLIHFLVLKILLF